MLSDNIRRFSRESWEAAQKDLAKPAGPPKGSWTGSPEMNGASWSWPRDPPRL